MFTKLKAISAIVIATYASPVLALGVGSIDMKSSMNEPLDATIQLYGTEGMSTGQLIARMGSMQDFERAGVIREYFLDDVRFVVELDNAGGGVIRLRTDNPVVEPYLNFVLDLRWPDGRILREYTALIDFMPLEQAAPVSAARVNQGGSVTAEIDESLSRFGQNDTQYRVANGDTLWDIALQVRPSRAYSPQQTMRAIVDNNPQAFQGGNINGLRAGAVLDLPSETQIANVDGNEARRWVRNQNNRWSSPQTSPVESVTEIRIVDTPEVLSEGEGAYLRLARAEDAAPDEVQAPEATSNQLVDVVEPEPVAQEILDEPAQQRLTSTLEDLDRSERQNEELQARLAALEEQVQTMQRLMALKDQQLAKISAQPTSTDDLLKHPGVLGGAGAILLAALGWLFWSRRKPKEDVPGDMPVPVFAMPDTSLQESSPPVVPAAQSHVAEAPATTPQDAITKTTPPVTSVDETATTDRTDNDMGSALPAEITPIEELLTEVDIYVAYGRATKALELVKGIYADHPLNETVQLKLLEVAAAAGVAAQYMDVREALQGSPDAEIQAGLLKIAAEYPQAKAKEAVVDDTITSEQVLNDSTVKPEASEDHVPEEETLGWDIGLEEGGAVTGTDGLATETTEADFAADASVFDTPSEDAAALDESLNIEDDLSLESEALADDDSPNDTLKALQQSAAFDGEDMDFDSLELDDSAFDDAMPVDNIEEELPDVEMDEGAEDVALDTAFLDDETDGRDEPLDLDTLTNLEDEPVDLDELADLDDFDLDSLGDLDGDLTEEDADAMDLGELSLEDGDDLSLDDMMASAFPEDDTDGLLDDTDDMTTKLDMARAYIEMGEHESAIEVLDEVIQGGTAEQQSEAAELKGTLS